MNTGLLRHAVATVLTVYGIETLVMNSITGGAIWRVATVLTVYGIETFELLLLAFGQILLQQCLPFTVLKPTNTSDKSTTNKVATVLTVYGIETYGANPHSSPHSCNSAYRLRY